MRDINRIVSQNIRRHRLAKKWTQEQLAFKAKLHRAYIGQVERGEKRIGLSNLDKLAAALQVEITSFFHQ